MTELTYEVPTVGEKHQASDQRVSTALTEIKSVLNGRLTASNFLTETLTPKKFTKPTVQSETFGVTLTLAETKEIKRTVSSNSSILLSLIGGAALTVKTVLKVGTTNVASIRADSSGETVPVGPFRVPAGETWTLEAVLGGGKIEPTSTITTWSGVV